MNLVSAVAMLVLTSGCTRPAPTGPTDGEAKSAAPGETAATAAPRPPSSKELPMAPDDVENTYRRLRSSTMGPRVVLDPATRPYVTTLAVAFAPLKLDPAAIGFYAPTSAELDACEQRFLIDARDELRAGRVRLLPVERAHALAPIFRDFDRYERQAVGWSTAVRGKQTRYIYLRFRRPSGHLPPLDTEYHVRDGGHSYFELQCNMSTTPPTLFNVDVNGES